MYHLSFLLPEDNDSCIPQGVILFNLNLDLETISKTNIVLFLKI